MHISAIVALPGLKADQRKLAQLTTWIVNQRLLGDTNPLVTRQVIEEIKNTPPLSVMERVDRLLIYVDKASLAAGIRIIYQHKLEYMYEKSNMVTDDDRAYYSSYLEMLAWSESYDRSELDYFIEYATHKGWVSSGEINGIPRRRWLRLNVEGYTHLAELDNTAVKSDQGFVAMWFDESMNDAYENGIRVAIEEAGYKSLRVDRSEHVNKIDDEIVAEIRRSRFVVADFTHGEGGPRGGVYYEAGFAHGLNLPVIWTCQKEAFDKGIHFDLRQYNFLVWETAEELKDRLTARISAVIGDGPHRKP